ncbi:MAG: hypothetical protein WAR83_02800 [Flavobacteriales bacterium]
MHKIHPLNKYRKVLGMGMGVAIGTAIGVGTANLSLWISLG